MGVLFWVLPEKELTEWTAGAWLHRKLFLIVQHFSTSHSVGSDVLLVPAIFTNQEVLLDCCQSVHQEAFASARDSCAEG